jgi:hypothetical protein
VIDFLMEAFQSLGVIVFSEIAKQSDKNSTRKMLRDRLHRQHRQERQTFKIVDVYKALKWPLSSDMILLCSLEEFLEVFPDYCAGFGPSSGDLNRIRIEHVWKALLANDQNVELFAQAISRNQTVWMTENGWIVLIDLLEKQMPKSLTLSWVHFFKAVLIADTRRKKMIRENGLILWTDLNIVGLNQLINVYLTSDVISLREGAMRILLELFDKIHVPGLVILFENLPGMGQSDSEVIRAFNLISSFVESRLRTREVSDLGLKPHKLHSKKGQLKITISNPQNEKVERYVSPSISISGLIVRTMLSFGVGFENCELFQGNRKLPEEWTLEMCGITSDEELVLRYPPNSKKVNYLTGIVEYELSNSGFAAVALDILHRVDIPEELGRLIGQLLNNIMTPIDIQSVLELPQMAIQRIEESLNEYERLYFLRGILNTVKN